MQHHHVEQYECDVCGTRFKEVRQAEVCESAGRPEPRFRLGDRVRLIEGDYKGQFPHRIFTIDKNEVFLEKPGLDLWEQGEPGNHTVFYVLRGHDGLRITFVPEYHLGVAGRSSDAQDHH